MRRAGGPRSAATSSTRSGSTASRPTAASTPGVASSRYLDGRRGDEKNNTFPVAYAKAYGDLLRRPGKAPVTFSRAGFTGSQAHGAFWAGDENSTWEAFRWSLFAGLNAAASGVVYWGWDIAGLQRRRARPPSCTCARRPRRRSCRSCSTTRSSTTTARRRATAPPGTSPSAPATSGCCRCSAPSPSCASGSCRTWRPRPAARSRRASRSCGRCSSITRATSEVWRHPLQWMLGDSLLVAPVTEEGATAVRAYLPPGDWVDAFTGDGRRGRSGRRAARPRSTRCRFGSVPPTGCACARCSGGSHRAGIGCRAAGRRDPRLGTPWHPIRLRRAAPPSPSRSRRGSSRRSPDSPARSPCSSRDFRLVGATPAEAASGLLVLCVVQGVLAIALSLRYRMPISIAWSTPGAALMVAAKGLTDDFSAAVGCFRAVRHPAAHHRAVAMAGAGDDPHPEADRERDAGRDPAADLPRAGAGIDRRHLVAGSRRSSWCGWCWPAWRRAGPSRRRRGDRDRGRHRDRREPAGGAVDRAHSAVRRCPASIPPC